MGKNMNGDDIKWSNPTMLYFPPEMKLRHRITCLLGYHKRETRNAAPDHKGFMNGKEIYLGSMKLRDQCGRCGALL